MSFLSSKDQVDVATGLVVALFALVLFAFTFLLPDVRDSDPLGMAFFPRMLLLAMLALSATLGIRAWTRRASSSSGETGTEPSVDEDSEPQQVGNVALGVAATVAYGIGIPIVGYFWITPPFLAFLLWIGGLRRPVSIALVTLGFVAFAYFVLYRALGIPLTTM
jgi:putative tricarboxylic transport membrane protein